jgi:hypothetical protein
MLCWVMEVALKRLEPCAGKLARTVLRRVVAGNSHGLSDVRHEVAKMSCFSDEETTYATG